VEPTSTRHRRSPWLLLTLSCAAAALFVLGGGPAAMSAILGETGTDAPWIATDEPDYQAGDSVTLTGGNWLAGEAVTIVVNDTLDQSWSQTDHVTADESGGFVDQVVLPDYFVSDYSVTATGESSGTATTDFTDSLLPTGATVNGASAIVVGPGDPVPGGLTTTIGTGTEPNAWQATKWTIGSATDCQNKGLADDHSTNGTFSEFFDMTAPSTPGTYSVTMQPYDSGTCMSGTGGSTFTLSNAVTVDSSVLFSEYFGSAVSSDTPFWKDENQVAADDCSVSGPLTGNWFEALERGCTISTTNVNSRSINSADRQNIHVRFTWGKNNPPSGSSLNLYWKPESASAWNGPLCQTSPPQPCTSGVGPTVSNIGPGTSTPTANSVDVTLPAAAENTSIDIRFQGNTSSSAGNLRLDAVRVTGDVETTPPDTTITANPAVLSNSNSAGFSFTGSDNMTPVASLTFQCKLDAGSFGTCTSPENLSGLSDASHTFRVRAIDQAGNVDPTPASYTWTVDTAPPDTSITAKPTNPTASTAASFSFSGSDSAGSGIASFECKLDAGSFAACTSPQAYSSLSDGSHTFSVRAIDQAGNLDPTSASYTWTVDTTPPDTTITSNPPNPSNSGAASFGFSGSDPGGSGVASFECKLDAGSFGTCTSPKSYSGLALGPHTFQVRAKDAAGNLDPTPASYTWEVHATTSLLSNGAQIVTQGTNAVLGAKLSSTASSCVSGGTLTFTFTDNNPTTAALDDGPYTAGSANTDSSGQANLTINTTGWSEGVYTVRVRFAGTASCDASFDDATLVISLPGQSSSGGGWYTLPGSGRLNFGYVVNRVPNSDPAQYKGQVLLINNGKWRLKGQLDTYTKVTTGTIKVNGGGTVTCTTTAACGSGSGTGNLYWWNATLNGGLGDWAKTADSPVRYTINFVDNGQGGKNSADRMGITINHAISAGEPGTLPNALPEVIKGGDVKIT
jgi:hypothetical protein